MTKAQKSQREQIISRLADDFERSGEAFTCAAVVIRQAMPGAVTLCRDTIHRPDTIALRVADEMHRRRKVANGSA